MRLVSIRGTLYFISIIANVGALHCWKWTESGSHCECEKEECSNSITKCGTQGLEDEADSLEISGCLNDDECSGIAILGTSISATCCSENYCNNGAKPTCCSEAATVSRVNSWIITMFVMTSLLLMVFG